MHDAGDVEIDATDRELLRVAEAALEHAYAPYSRFRVGAAVLTESGSVYGGCNVENASLSVGTCAERNAVANAVAQEGPTVAIVRVAVLAKNEWDDAQACSPCGACRQSLAEFARSATVLFRGEGLFLRRTPLAALLPDAFKFGG